MIVKRELKVLSEEEFNDLYRTFWKKLCSVSYTYVRDKTIALELVQDVFVKLWIKRDNIKQIADIEAYLFKCLKNKIYDHFDSEACRKKHLTSVLNNFPEKSYTEDDTHVFNETLTVISEELERMPEKTRIIFQMSKFGHHSNVEIASKMHLSVKAVEYHVTQAVKKLRVRLALLLP
jgi:RNA polymerase sigma-70 factor (family 1)